MIQWIKRHLYWLCVIFLLIAICIFLLYSWIDSRVTIEYAFQEQKEMRREIEVLQKLFLSSGRQMNRNEIELLVIDQFGEDHLIKREDQNELSIDNVILEFKGGALVKIKSLNE